MNSRAMACLVLTWSLVSLATVPADAEQSNTTPAAGSDWREKLPEEARGLFDQLWAQTEGRPQARARLVETVQAVAIHNRAGQTYGGIAALGAAAAGGTVAAAVVAGACSGALAGPAGLLAGAAVGGLCYLAVRNELAKAAVASLEDFKAKDDAQLRSGLPAAGDPGSTTSGEGASARVESGSSPRSDMAPATQPAAAVDLLGVRQQ